MPTYREALVGYTTLRNKLHLDTKGMESTGKPNCGQGRIIEIVHHASDVLSMARATEMVTGYAKATEAPLCARCFKVGA